MKSRDVYVSPHPGDAVMSCAGRIFRDRRAGAEIYVVTPFTALAGGEEQRAEDVQALNILGAAYCHLGMKPGEHPAEALLRTIERLKPDRVLFPLGVEGSPDHESLFAVSRNLSVIPVCYYEERPEVFVANALRIHLLKKGFWTKRAVTNRRELLREHFEGLRTIFHAKKAFPPGKERYRYGLRIARELEHAAQNKEGMRGDVMMFEDENFPAVLRSVSAYRSQILKKFGSVEKFCQETEEYCRRLAGGGYAERYWRFDKVRSAHPGLAER